MSNSVQLPQDVSRLIPSFYAKADLHDSSLKCPKELDDEEDDLGCTSFSFKGEVELGSEDKCDEDGNFSDGEGVETAANSRVTSTPFDPAQSGRRRRRRQFTGREFPDGAFYGYGRHRAGGEICEHTL